MTEAQKYRKKPVVIEAMRWDGTASGATPIINWILESGGTATYHEHLMDGDFIAHPDPFLRIKTLEGVIVGTSGDWIIKGVQGEFYPCRDDIFRQTYEALNDGGVRTTASCCGHGTNHSSIGLADGRWLLIVDDAEFQAMDSRTSQPVQVEVTEDMVKRAAMALGEFVTHGPITDLSGPNGAYWTREARFALAAALGGGDHAES